jgi:uncharacterized protein (DUF433 family)
MMKLANVLFGLFGYELVAKDSDIIRLSAETIHVADVARPLVARLERTEGLSLEYRRHEVYAALLKRFPHVPAMDVSIAIEYALRRYRSGEAP